jgi:hypothetical protein
MAPVLGAKLETQSRNQQFRAVFRRKRLDRLDPLFHLRLVEPGRRRAARQRIADREKEFVQPRRTNTGRIR